MRNFLFGHSNRAAMAWFLLGLIGCAAILCCGDSASAVVPGGNVMITDWEFYHGTTGGGQGSPQYHEDSMNFQIIVFGAEDPESVAITVTINGHFVDFYWLTGYAEDRNYESLKLPDGTFTDLIWDSYIISDDPSTIPGDDSSTIPTADEYVVHVECWNTLTGNKFEAQHTFGH